MREYFLLQYTLCSRTRIFPLSPVEVFQYLRFLAEIFLSYPLIQYSSSSPFLNYVNVLPCETQQYKIMPEHCSC